MDGMKTGSENVFEVTLNGETKVITASDSSSAARQAFGAEGNNARVKQIQMKKWT